MTDYVQFFFLDVRSYLFIYFIIFAMLLKGVLASYHKYVLCDEKWWIALIPFSQHYLRVANYCCIPKFAAVICILLELNFYYTCCLFPFLEVLVYHYICMYKEWEVFDLGNKWMYTFVPLYKYALLILEVKNERTDSRRRISGSD